MPFPKHLPRETDRGIGVYFFKETKMETWKEIIKLINAWQHTKRVPGTSIQGDEDIFLATMDADFVLIKRTEVKEFLFKDGYSVYLVKNEEESNEERNYDA